MIQEQFKTLDALCSAFYWYKDSSGKKIPLRAKGKNKALDYQQSLKQAGEEKNLKLGVFLEDTDLLILDIDNANDDEEVRLIREELSRYGVEVDYWVPSQSGEPGKAHLYCFVENREDLNRIEGEQLFWESKIMGEIRRGGKGNLIFLSDIGYTKFLERYEEAPRAPDTIDAFIRWQEEHRIRSRMKASRRFDNIDYEDTAVLTTLLTKIGERNLNYRDLLGNRYYAGDETSIVTLHSLARELADTDGLPVSELEVIEKSAEKYWSRDYTILTHDVMIEQIRGTGLIKSNDAGILLSPGPDGVWSEKDVYQYYRETRDRLLDEYFSRNPPTKAARRSNIEKVESVSWQRAIYAGLLADSADIPMFDNDPNLLGVKRGIFDLSRGRIVRKGHISQRTGYSPDFGGSPRLQETLKVWSAGDNELMELMRLGLGLCVAGVPTQHLLIAFGEPGTGKSSYAHLIRRLLGEYAGSTLAYRFAKGYEAHSAWILDFIHKKRLSVIVDANFSRGFDSDKMNAMLGTETISADYKGGKYVHFVPFATILVTMSKYPRVDSDDGILRRAIPIPFLNREILDSEDKQFVEHLLEEEGDLILGEVIEAYWELEETGFDLHRFMPRVSQEFLTELKEEADPVQTYMSSRVKVGGEVKGTDLYEDFVEWTIENQGENRYTIARSFYRALRNTVFFHQHVEREDRVGKEHELVFFGISLDE